MPGTVSMCTPSAPSLTLVKKVVNDDGGSATPSNWTLHAQGPSGFSGPGPNVSSGAAFQAGTYHLSESGGPAGYTASDGAGEGGTQVDAATVSLGAGEPSPPRRETAGVRPFVRSLCAHQNPVGLGHRGTTQPDPR